MIDLSLTSIYFFSRYPPGKLEASPRSDREFREKLIVDGKVASSEGMEGLEETPNGISRKGSYRNEDPLDGRT